jgi:tRNA pseudouridine38-40 synthase
MPRYFIEVSYKGTAYSGFQVQANANSVQAEVEKAFSTYFRQPVPMTGSSRTDTGVHAFSNYFHFDLEGGVEGEAAYHLNCILPPDIGIRRIIPVGERAHCRYDALSREYAYFLYREKNPFYTDRGYYYPYRLDFGLLEAAAALIPGDQDFTGFAKRNTQVKDFRCRVMESRWEQAGDQWVFRIRANRFLRGMVRGLTGTMLLVGRGSITVEDFGAIIRARDPSRVNFNVPGQGLFLVRVEYPATLVPERGGGAGAAGADFF